MIHNQLRSYYIDWGEYPKTLKTRLNTLQIEEQL